MLTITSYGLSDIEVYYPSTTSFYAGADAQPRDLHKNATDVKWILQDRRSAAQQDSLSINVQSFDVIIYVKDLTDYKLFTDHNQAKV